MEFYLDFLFSNVYILYLDVEIVGKSTKILRKGKVAEIFVKSSQQ